MAAGLVGLAMVLMLVERCWGGWGGCGVLTRVGVYGILWGEGKTSKAYGGDLAAFIRWWEPTAGEAFHPQAVDPREIVECRGYLLSRGQEPATANRRLIALRGFFRWARQSGLARENPFEGMERVLVKQQKDTAPRWLDRKEQLALMRAVRRGESVRDLAVVQTLLGTGLRMSELATLQVRDVEISDKKDWLCGRLGKGSNGCSVSTVVDTPVQSRICRMCGFVGWGPSAELECDPCPLHP